MKQKPTGRPSSSEQIIRDIKRKTRKQYGAEEKIRIVLDGLRGEECHRLNCDDEFTTVSQKPMETLYESLLFCIDYVDAHCTHAGHNVRRCACESCHWVRSARRVASDYRYVRRPH